MGLSLRTRLKSFLQLYLWRGGGCITLQGVALMPCFGEWSPGPLISSMLNPLSTIHSTASKEDRIQSLPYFHFATFIKYYDPYLNRHLSICIIVLCKLQPFKLHKLMLTYLSCQRKQGGTGSYNSVSKYLNVSLTMFTTKNCRSPTYVTLSWMMFTSN